LVGYRGPFRFALEQAKSVVIGGIYASVFPC
jgi:hypothetical protein